MEEAEVMIFECASCLNRTKRLFESYDFLLPAAASSPIPGDNTVPTGNVDNTAINWDNDKDADSKQSTNQKREAPKLKYDFYLLFTNRKANRCQTCRKHFSLNSPGNLMIGKYGTFPAITRKGVRGSTRNYYFCVGQKCLREKFKNFHWDLLTVEAQIKDQLTIPNVKWLDDKGVRIKFP